VEPGRRIELLTYALRGGLGLCLEDSGRASVLLTRSYQIGRNVVPAREAAALWDGYGMRLPGRPHLSKQIGRPLRHHPACRGGTARRQRSSGLGQSSGCSAFSYPMSCRRRLRQAKVCPVEPDLLIRRLPRGHFRGSRQVPNCLKYAGQMGCDFLGREIVWDSMLRTGTRLLAFLLALYGVRSHGVSSMLPAAFRDEELESSRFLLTSRRLHLA
jgi:hypothetical protein